MNESKFAELVADRVCQKLLFIGGIITVVTGLSIIAFTSVLPSVTVEVYKKELKGF